MKRSTQRFKIPLFLGKRIKIMAENRLDRFKLAGRRADKLAADRREHAAG